jgi:hypothetical protein
VDVRSDVILFGRDALKQAIENLEQDGFQVQTPPPEMLGHGVVLTAYHPEREEGFLLSGPEVQLVARYGLAALDPHREPDERKPRWQREDSRKREQKYVEAALARAVQEVQSAAPGNRNNALARAAWSLGRLEALGLDRERALAELEQAALSTGLSLAEARTTAVRSFEAGAKRPRDLPPNNGFHANPLAEKQSPWLSQKSDFTPRLTTQWNRPEKKKKGGW